MDGFLIDLNVTKYKMKYKMEPPKLVVKPPQSFYDMQAQFMQRGFMEMKDWLKQQVHQHLLAASQLKYHKVKCNIEVENIEVDKVTLFTVNGEEINSFDDIHPDCKAIVLSTDGVFRGLVNSLRPAEISEQRIIHEKSIRQVFKDVKEDFSHHNK